MGYFQKQWIPKLCDILAEHDGHKLRRNNAMHELYDIADGSTSYIGSSRGNDEKDIAEWERWLRGQNILKEGEHVD